MYKVSEIVLPIYLNGQCPIIKTCSDVTLNLSSKDSTFLLIINEQINEISCGLVALNTCFYFFIFFFYFFCQIGFYGQ